MLSNNQLDSIIQPSGIATQRVVRYVRSMQNAYEDSNIDALYYIFDRDVEVLELKVKDSFLVDRDLVNSTKGFESPSYSLGIKY
jgi:hypothetical protein